MGEHSTQSANLIKSAEGWLPVSSRGGHSQLRVELSGQCGGEACACLLGALGAACDRIGDEAPARALPGAGGEHQPAPAGVVFVEGRLAAGVEAARLPAQEGVTT